MDGSAAVKNDMLLSTELPGSPSSGADVLKSDKKLLSTAVPNHRRLGAAAATAAKNDYESPQSCRIIVIIYLSGAAAVVNCSTATTHYYSTACSTFQAEP